MKGTRSTVSEESGLPNTQRRDDALKSLDKTIKGRERKAKTAPLGVMAATVAVLALIVGGIYFATTYTGSSNEDTETTAEGQDQAEEQNQQQASLPEGPLKPYPETVSCEYPSDGEAAKDVEKPGGEGIATSGTVKVKLATTAGDIPIELDRGTSPCSVNSFESLVKQNFFNDTVCHRHVKSEQMGILQCGDPTGTGTGGPGYKFDDEFPLNGVAEDATQQPLTYPRGTLAMANSGPGTNGSQFFLVTKDTTLPPAYNVFGTIDEAGLKTLDKIAEKAPEGDSKPAEEVKITTANVE